jgi:hypothetical protein
MSEHRMAVRCSLFWVLLSLRWIDTDVLLAWLQSRGERFIAYYGSFDPRPASSRASDLILTRVGSPGSRAVASLTQVTHLRSFGNSGLYNRLNLIIQANR